MQDIQDYLLKSGRIYIYGEISDSLKTIQELTYLSDLGYKLIHIYVNSLGGDPDCSLGIIDKICELKESGITINTVVCDIAYSAAADIIVFGSEAFGNQHCKLMMHSAKYSLDYDEIHKQSVSIEFEKTQQDLLTQKIANICGHRTKKSAKDFAEKIKNDLWTDLKGAVKLGLLDRQYTKEDEKKLIETNRHFISNADGLND